MIETLVKVALESMGPFGSTGDSSEAKGFPKFSEKTTDKTTPPVQLEQWRKELKIGDSIDAMQLGCWFQAKIVDSNDDSLLVQLDGWSSTWNFWAPRVSYMIQPFQSQAKAGYENLMKPNDILQLDSDTEIDEEFSVSSPSNQEKLERSIVQNILNCNDRLSCPSGGLNDRCMASMTTSENMQPKQLSPKQKLIYTDQSNKTSKISEGHSGSTSKENLMSRFRGDGKKSACEQILLPLSSSSNGCKLDSSVSNSRLKSILGIPKFTRISCLPTNSNGDSGQNLKMFHTASSYASSLLQSASANEITNLQKENIVLRQRLIDSEAEKFQIQKDLGAEVKRLRKLMLHFFNSAYSQQKSEVLYKRKLKSLEWEVSESKKRLASTMSDQNKSG